MIDFLDLRKFFDTNATELNLEDQIYLEDFENATDGQVNEQVSDLSLSISFETGTLYENAVRKLKAAAPNLKHVKFNGGYVYDPEEDVSLLVDFSYS